MNMEFSFVVGTRDSNKSSYLAVNGAVDIKNMLERRKFNAPVIIINI